MPLEKPPGGQGLHHADRALGAHDGGVAVLAGDVQAGLTRELRFRRRRPRPLLASRLPANSSDSGDLAHVGDRLGAAEGFEELVGDPVHRVELEDLQDEDRPGQQRTDNQPDHHDLNEDLGVHEHFPWAEVSGVGAAYLGGCRVGRSRTVAAAAGAGAAAAGARGGGRRRGRRVLRYRRRSCQQRERADQGQKGGGSFCVKHRFASSCLVSARSRTRRDRRAGRLSALAGGGPARTRHRRPRKSKAIVATTVSPRSAPFSFAGLRSSRFEALVDPPSAWAAATPYRNVRLTARVLWQPLISPSRGRRRSLFRDRKFNCGVCLQRSIVRPLTSCSIFGRALDLAVLHRSREA